MTESEWLACCNPSPMLQFLRGQASHRKLRLFGCACCRRVWHLLPDEHSRNAVVVAERLTAGAADRQELEAALDLAFSAQEGHAEDARVAAARISTEDGGELASFVESVAALAGAAAGWAADPDAPWSTNADAPTSVPHHTARNAETTVQAHLLRCIFGNPFRPTALDPSWLTWKENLVVRLAQSIDAERAFARLPILADALEDAGCTNDDLLRHLHEPGAHARGCWALDVILGRE